MLSLQSTLSKFRTYRHFNLICIILLFSVLRLFSLFVFYNGFTLNFKKLSSFISSDFIKSVVEYVPYYNFSICLGSFLHPLFLIALVVIGLPLFIKRNILFNLSVSKTDKLIIVTSAFLLSWELCTYNYNYYLNSAFYFDRVLLLVFPFLLWRWPVLSAIYVPLAMVYRSQFNYPVDGFELFDKRLLFDLLLMFVAVIYCDVYFKQSTKKYFYLALCIIASDYFVTGISKLLISPHGYEWATDNRISDLFLNAHQRGWLVDFSEKQIENIHAVLLKYNVFLQVIVLLLELTAIMILRNVHTAILLIALLFVMHLAIFLIGGIFFWKWMLIDLLVLAIIISNKSNFYPDIFTKTNFKVSLIIITTSFIWLRPYTIGWFDTRINQFFIYEAEDLRGQTLELNKNDFNPYHQWIQYDKLLFLVDDKCLPVSGFGYTISYSIKQGLDTIKPDNIQSFISQNGEVFFDKQKADAFNQFMFTFFKNRNANYTKLLLTKFHAPNHLYHSGRTCGLNCLDKIKKLNVFYCLTYNQGWRTKTLTKKLVAKINI